MASIPNNKSGFTLLITLLAVSALLAISASILQVTIKQYQFSDISKDSEIAFHAANAGMECALFYDLGVDSGGTPFNTFDVLGGVTPSARTSIECMDLPSSSNDLEGGSRYSGQEQRFRFTWGDVGQEVCTEISVYKFFNEFADEDMGTVLGSPRDCVMGTECTVVEARGYNAPCADLSTPSPRIVERELTLVY